MIITNSFIGQFQKKVLETIQENHLINQGEGVVVGVSGGPDSVCLLHVLHTLSKMLDINLFTIHVNHMLRAGEAKEDELYTSNLCQELGIPFSVVHIDVALMSRELKMSLEEAGREARYREFSCYAQTIGAGKIAVAHNRNDQAETVMMHIIRGSGSAGLVGMQYNRGNIIRPLLNIYREDIEKYCKEAGLFPRTDSSNLADEFTRNRIRLGLFPYINQNFDANIVDSLCRLSSHVSEDNRFLDHLARESYDACIQSEESEKVALKIDALRSLDTAIRSRVLRMAICLAAGSSNGIGNVHYQMLSEQIIKGKTGSRTELPGGIRADISYGMLELSSVKHPNEKQKNEIISFPTELKVPGITVLSELGMEIETSFEEIENIDKCVLLGYNPWVHYFDYEALKKGIHIRNRGNGDVFSPFRSNGTKKLKEFFIDSKIPREKRDGIPLICMDNEVVWVMGYKISDKFKVTENTKIVLKIAYMRRVSR